MPPDAFGRFRVLHQIGAGTLGPVYRAHDPVSDRPVAVKLFTLDMSPDRVQQFVAELQQLVGVHLAHPAIAAPLAAGQHGASAYLVQELVSADAVDQVIHEFGAAPPNDALRVVAQLAGALDFANAVKVRHGALHPRDVLLSSDETRVTGLGVAHALEKIGMGAPVRRPYTPPERIAAGEWDRRSDVFSLAAIAHELLWARRIGGTGAHAAEGVTAIAGGDVTALKGLFARALAEDASERFESALQFADALRAAFPDVEASIQAPALQQIQDDFAEGSAMFPQAQPVRETKPEEIRRPAPPVTEVQPKPAPAAQLPLIDRKGEIDLPLSEVARAEEQRFRDVEAAPAIVPQAAATPPEQAAPSRYLDYVRDDQPVTPTPAAQIPPPIVVRPVLPEPTVTREPAPSNRAPMLLALAVGLIVGFGAGYGFGLRQRPAPVVPPAADATPAPGREFTESAVPVPDAQRPAAADPAPAAANTDAAGAATAAASAAATRTPPPAAPPPAPAPAASAAAAVPPTEGRVLVRTTPAGARVFVDDREYGVTPFAVRNLSHGAHRVRVVRDGYTPEDRRVVLTASQPSQSLTIALERPGAPAAARAAQTPRPDETGSTGRFSGDLYIESRPAGATVFVDGRSVGSTPLTLRGVAAGSHVIRLEHDGYRRWSSAVRVVASQANRITASLER